MGRDREPPVNRVLYHLLKWSVVSPLLHAYFRGHVEGADLVPKTGPLVVASNHASYFDPPLLSCAVQRPVAFMAKEELFKNALFAKAIRLYGAYPVKRRAADINAIRTALEYLEDGWATGVFLSGTRTRDGRIPSPKPGAALIAAKAGVPILPVALCGTEKIFAAGSSMPQSVPVTIRIGEPLDPPASEQRDDLKAVTERCARAIEMLYDRGRSAAEQ